MPRETYSNLRPLSTPPGEPNGSSGYSTVSRIGTISIWCVAPFDAVRPRERRASHLTRCLTHRILSRFSSTWVAETF